MIKIERFKSCGVVGGMGPYATCQFFKSVLDNTPANKDWEHLRILIDSNVYIPSRTRYLLYNEESPVKGMVDSINNLSLIGADFVVVPCNSAHYFYNDVVSKIDVPWLSMPEIVAACMYSHKYTHPLIIGGYITTEKKIYSKYINNAYYLDSKGNRFFESVIEEIKLNSDIAENTESTMLDIIDRHKDKYDCIILACTEYSLISDKFKMSGVKVFDSNVIYANEAIRYAKNIV